MEKRYDYTISHDNSPEVFRKICDIIARAFPELKMDDVLIDVDGSTIQIFGEEPLEIIVYDDYDVGAVYVKSDLDLSEIAESMRCSTDELQHRALLEV